MSSLANSASSLPSTPSHRYLNYTTNMSSLPHRNVQGSAESLPHNICPKKQLIELECIMLWERKYALLLAKARQARDFRAFSSSSSAKPPQHYLSRASKYRSEIDNLYRVYFCDWAPADTTLPPPHSSGLSPAQLAELTSKLMAIHPLPLTADETRRVTRDLEKSERRLMAKHAELVDLDANTLREQSINPETFLRKYNIWVKRYEVLEDIRKVKHDISFDKATLSGKPLSNSSVSRP